MTLCASWIDSQCDITCTIYALFFFFFLLILFLYFYSFFLVDKANMIKQLHLQDGLNESNSLSSLPFNDTDD